MSTIPLKLVKKISVDITSYSEGNYDTDGIWQDGGTTVTTIQANVQPTTGEELKDLPENQRDKSVISLWTASTLKTVSEKNKTSADTLVYEGDTYEIHKVKAWKMGVRDHYHIIAVKEDE